NKCKGFNTVRGVVRKGHGVDRVSARTSNTGRPRRCIGDVPGPRWRRDAMAPRTASAFGPHQKRCAKCSFTFDVEVISRVKGLPSSLSDMMVEEDAGFRGFRSSDARVGQCRGNSGQ